jgi:hypothetical protein
MAVSQYVRDLQCGDRERTRLLERNIRDPRARYEIAELDYHYRQPHENSMGMSLM